MTHFKITGITERHAVPEQRHDADHERRLHHVRAGQRRPEVHADRELRPAPASASTCRRRLSSVDAGLGGGTATATITVNAVADTPSRDQRHDQRGHADDERLVISRNAADGTEVTHFKITSITERHAVPERRHDADRNGDFITFAEGNAGLKFTPAPNFSGTGSFKVQASTSAPTPASAAARSTATITVNAGRRHAVGDQRDDQRGHADTSGLVISRNAADGAEVTHFKITASPTARCTRTTARRRSPTTTSSPSPRATPG